MEDGVMTSASLHKSDVILFQNDLITRFLVVMVSTYI